jgi:RHS repeat-associated protein
VPLGEILSNCTEGIFFIRPQVLDGPGKNVFRYDGSASGRMLYNWHRDYNPALGRYVQSDPIGLGGGINTYAYVEGTPVSETDAEGLVPNVMEGACVAGPNPVCDCGLIVDAITWGVAPAAAAAGGVVLSNSSDDRSVNSPVNRMQRQYEAAKARCTPPNPQPDLDPKANCSAISKMIDMLQNSVDRYTWWDNSYYPGRHAQKISEIENRIKNLKDKYDKDCTGCK